MKKAIALLFVAMFAFALADVQAFAEEPPEEKTLTLTWDIPNERVNGDVMTFEEISHYELRCALTDGSGEFTSMAIPSVSDGGIYKGQMVDIFPEHGIYDCEMAVIDTFGIYSNYVLVQNGPIKYFPPAPSAPTNVLILIE